MIQKTEKEFPLKTSVFPASNIRDFIENPDYLDKMKRGT